MNHKENDFRKICLHCASIYESEDEEVITCPVCGKSIQLSEYEGLMQSIRLAVFSGWTCRIRYEKEDDGRRYYTEQCGEMLNFVALAMVSGIIGNLAYDTVKKVLAIIREYLKQSGENEEDKTLIDFLESDEKIRNLAEYISAYYEEFDKVDTDTKNAIMEEVFVHSASSIMDALIQLNHKDIDIEKVMEESPHTREDILKMILEIRGGIFAKKPEKSDFVGFWDDIDID